MSVSLVDPPHHFHYAFNTPFFDLNSESYAVMTPQIDFTRQHEKEQSQGSQLRRENKSYQLGRRNQRLSTKKRNWEPHDLEGREQRQSNIILTSKGGSNTSDLRYIKMNRQSKTYEN